MREIALKLVLCLVFLGTACIINMPVHAGEADNYSLGDLQQENADGMTWWHLPGVNIGAGKKSGKPILSGEGRVLLQAKKAIEEIKLGPFSVKAKAGSVLVLDRIGNQVRLMVLRGHATVTDAQRKIELPTSYQIVSAPANHKQQFIDDGVVRRPIELTYDSQNNSKVFVRQFFLEQLVYVDPMMRTLHHRGGKEKAFVEKLNKTGAILRDHNGTGNYYADQM